MPQWKEYFSLMSTQWIDERNRLLSETINVTTKVSIFIYPILELLESPDEPNMATIII